jgi:hypothetical protein
MIPRSLISLAAVALSFALAACSGSESSDVPAPEGVVDENELRSPSFSGTYAANGADDGDGISGVKVEQRGPKLVITLDEYGTPFTYDLTKTRSGAYVFTSGEISGECDDPGCNYTSKHSGVVYLKKVGTKKVPTAKINVTTMYPYPESEGDLEGEQTNTLRWSKKSR